jgi:uncharacterized membrane protein
MRNGWLLVSIAASILGLAAALAVYAGVFGPLAELVPVHWNIRGEPDHKVPREQMLPYLLIWPGAMLALVLLTLVLPWLSPRSYDVERFRPTYHYIMAMVVLMIGYLEAVFLMISLGMHIPFLQVYLGGMFLFLAAIGNVLGKVRRNFWMGVRTPWTLASEAVWIRTHRLAAWTFVLGGLVGFVLVVLGVNPLAAFAVFLVAALTPVVYSLILYKQLEKQGRLDGPAEALSASAGSSQHQGEQS